MQTLPFVFLLLFSSSSLVIAADKEAPPAAAATRPSFLDRLAFSLQSRFQRPQSRDNDPDDSCMGRIDAVWCNEDETGRLVDIAYHNTHTGLQLVGCASKDWTDGASKALHLEDQESIIKFKTCKGGKKIGTLLTITTDAGRVFSCGGATNQAYTPYTSQGGDKPSDSSDSEWSEGDNSDASDVPEGGNSTTRISPGGQSRRHLLADGHRASKRATMLRCPSSLPSKDPSWSSLPRWWEHDGTDTEFGSVGSGANAYFKDGALHFYKDFATYEQQLDVYESKPDVLPYHPYYYYRQVYPLAAFGAKCDRKDTIRSLNYLCWNDAYKPEAQAEGDQVLLQLVLASNTDDSPPSCPETTEDVAAFNKDLDTMSTRLRLASDGLIRDTAWEEYTPGNCDVGDADAAAPNATVVILRAEMVSGTGDVQTESDVEPLAAPEPDVEAAISWLKSPGSDLCDVNYNNESICTDTGIQAIVLLNSRGVSSASSSAA